MKQVFQDVMQNIVMFKIREIIRRIKYFACMYDSSWYSYWVLEICLKNIRIWKRTSWTERKTQHPVWLVLGEILYGFHFQEILCTIQVSSLSGSGGWQYKLAYTDYLKIQGLLITVLPSMSISFDGYKIVSRLSSIFQNACILWNIWCYNYVL